MLINQWEIQDFSGGGATTQRLSIELLYGHLLNRMYEGEKITERSTALAQPPAPNQTTNVFLLVRSFKHLYSLIYIYF